MDIRLPRLGEGADSGTVVTVLVKVGDQVKQGQNVIELENEKAVATIPASAAGTVTRLHVKPGDMLAVGQLILSLSGAGGPTVPDVVKEPAAPARAAKIQEPESEEPLEDQAVEAPAAGLPPAASPSIRRVARELGVDLAKVKGSERGGRIVMADLRAHIRRLQQLAASPQSAVLVAAAPAQESIDFSRWGPVRKQSLSPIRQTIARRMAASWMTIPHVTQFHDADITRLLELKKRYGVAYEKQGAKLTVTAMLLPVIAQQLKAHPKFNCSFDEVSQEIVFKQYYHVGIAVDTEAGLLVPVIRDVDNKSVAELSKELQALAEKARKRAVSSEELQGGTFTISNQGGIGGAHFTPIIKKPEVAILGIGQGAVKPVVREGKVEPRMMLPLGLSYDHRVIDGADAARFIRDLVQAIDQYHEAMLKRV